MRSASAHTTVAIDKMQEGRQDACIGNNATTVIILSAKKRQHIAFCVIKVLEGNNLQNHTQEFVLGQLLRLSASATSNLITAGLLNCAKNTP